MICLTPGKRAQWSTVSKGNLELFLFCFFEKVSCNSVLSSAPYEYESKVDLELPPSSLSLQKLRSSPRVLRLCCSLQLGMWAAVRGHPTSGGGVLWSTRSPWAPEPQNQEWCTSVTWSFKRQRQEDHKVVVICCYRASSRSVWAL